MWEGRLTEGVHASFFGNRRKLLTPMGVVDAYGSLEPDEGLEALPLGGVLMLVWGLGSCLELVLLLWPYPKD